MPLLLLLTVVGAALALPGLAAARQEPRNPPPPTGPAVPAEPAGSFDDFAYPRGENVPYGWMACGYSFPNSFSDPSRCIADGYTLINDLFGNMSPANFGLQARRLEAQGRLRQFMPYLGWGPYRTLNGPEDTPPFPIDDAAQAQAWWDSRLEAIRREIAKTSDPDDVFGFYTTDEPIVVDELRYQYNAIKKHFPNAVVFAYGTTYGGPWSVLGDRLLVDDESRLTTVFGPNGQEAMPYVDAAGIAHYHTYRKSRNPERISHGMTYYKLQALVDGICTQYDYCRGQRDDAWSWKAQGKPLYYVPEAFRKACIVDAADPERGSEQLIYAKITNGIAQSIAAGAQGVLAYEYGRFREGEQSMACYDGVRDFYALYKELWPWIRAGDLERLAVKVTAGLARWESPPTWRYEPDHPTLVATELDLGGRKAVVVANLMSPADYAGSISGTVSGLDRGAYEQLALDQAAGAVLRREVAAPDGRIGVALPPYGYAIFVERLAAPAPARGAVYERWDGLETEVNADLASLRGDPRYPGRPTSRQVITDAVGLELPFHPGSDGTAQSFGSRLRTLIAPPVSGEYEFYFSADDSAELLLSTDERPANARRIALISRWAYHRDVRCERSRYCDLNTFRSPPVRLEAGRRYYVEINHVESIGEDHASVAWRLPGSEAVEIVPADRLWLPPDAPAP